MTSRPRGCTGRASNPRRKDNGATGSEALRCTTDVLPPKAFASRIPAKPATNPAPKIPAPVEIFVAKLSAGASELLIIISHWLTLPLQPGESKTAACTSGCEATKPEGKLHVFGTV
jgi:hypothetical protein